MFCTFLMEYDHLRVLAVSHLFEHHSNKECLSWRTMYSFSCLRCGSEESDWQSATVWQATAGMKWLKLRALSWLHVREEGKPFQLGSKGVHGLNSWYIFSSVHTTPCLVSSWIPLINDAILPVIDCRHHTFVTTLSLPRSCTHSLSPTSILKLENPKTNLSDTCLLFYFNDTISFQQHFIYK